MELKRRILFVGPYNFSEENATCITLRSILDHYVNYDKIAFLYPSSRSDLVPSNFGNYKYRIISPRFFNNIGNTSIAKNAVKKNVNSQSNVHKRPSISRRLLIVIHNVIKAYRSCIPLELNEDIESFVSSFNPEVIYTLGGNINEMRLCIQLSKHYGIPIIPHIMDDWINVSFTNSYLLAPVRKELVNTFNDLLCCSKVGMAICDKMAEEYQFRYGIPFYSAMNCVERSFYTQSKEFFGSSLRIVYAGGLHLNRIASIYFLCKILSRIHLFSLNFDIYTSNNDWKTYGYNLKDFSFVNYKGFVSREEMLKVQITSDILVHVESFDTANKIYTRLSMSTKIPEYLSSGKTIIAIGPSDIASIQYLKKYNAAITLTEFDETKAYNQIISVLKDKKTMSAMRDAAYNLYLTRHTRKKTIEVFNKCLTLSCE